MKKLLAVFMVALVIFTTLAMAVSAEGTSEETTAVIEITLPSEERTTRDIMNDEGLVVPINKWQFKESLLFKLFEKIYHIIMALFGKGEVNSDGSAANIVDGIGKALDERLSNIFG